METPQPTEQNARSESTGIPAADQDVAPDAPEIKAETAEQTLPVGERVGEEGRTEAELLTLAEFEAEHAADEDFVEQLKLCGGGDGS